jgi:hypothetical protein
MNSANIAKYGMQADYKSNPGGAIFGSIVAGAVYASVVTAIVGFLI